MDFTIDIHSALGPVYESTLLDLNKLTISAPNDCHTVSEVIRAHFLIADFCYSQGEGIGGIGPRDMSLLISSVSRQWVGFENKLKWNTIYERAATLLFGLVRNHSFHDANKRTALLSTAHYLLKNRLMLTESERKLENFTVEIAEKSLKKYPRYRDLCKDSIGDPEVRYISWYLRKHSRRIENSHRTVTYRDLDTILKSFNCYLSEPSGNRIDVNKRILEKKLFGKSKEKGVRVCRIGFPGWSKQVSRKDVRYLRDMLKLTPENGIDAAAFYKNADDIRGLIASYEGALRRLAFR